MFPVRPLRFTHTEAADPDKEKTGITYEYLINPLDITFIGPVFNYDEGFNKASVVPNKSSIVLKNSNEVIVDGGIGEIHKLWDSIIENLYEAVT